MGGAAVAAWLEIPEVLCSGFKTTRLRAVESPAESW